MKKYYLLLVMLVICSISINAKVDTNRKLNVVLIMADDLGYGDLSCYGNSNIKTPNIDKLAAEGIRFTDFHSNGVVCSPTRAALLTGRYQQRAGIEGVITAARHRTVGLSLDKITIADELKKHGYTCGIFGKWHLGYAPEFNPTFQGFNKFIGFVSGNVDYHAHIDQEGYLDWWRDSTITNEKGYSTDLITKYGVEFIKDNVDKPFFLYLPHETPHYPYQKRVDKEVRKVGVNKSIKISDEKIPAVYKEMIEVMDEGIGEILAVLKETGLDKNTIVIFCSDNGANNKGNNGVLRGFKGGVYEGGHRVPAIVWNPGKIKGGTTSNETIISMDIFPTILDFLNVKPADSNFDGRSIKDLLLNGDKLSERDLFWSYGRKKAIRSGAWKLISQISDEENRFELYDLSQDISEKNNLADQYPELVQQLKLKLLNWDKNVREGIDIVADRK